MERLPRLTPAPQEAIEEAQEVIGFALPRLLRRLYAEVGNGGFGPGYGIIGLRGGHRDDLGRTAVELSRRWRELPDGLLPLCTWGYAIYSFVDCTGAEAGMWACDPNPGAENDLFREPMTLAVWLERWVGGRLRQPWLLPGRARRPRRSRRPGARRSAAR